MIQFRVGEVSRIFSIPQSTLRYYDEIGLFQPKYTDQDNQYRYYTADQFVLLDTIIFLRKIGFSIQDIQRHMKNRTVESTLELFAEKLQDVQQQIQALEMAARKMEHKMHTLQTGMRLAEQPAIDFKTHPRRPISFIYHHEPIDLNGQWEDIYARELKKSIAEPVNNGAFTGDIGVIVDARSIDRHGPIMYSGLFKLLWDQQADSEGDHLPEGLYACYPHRGPYEAVRSSYEYLLNQLHALGYVRTGNPIEIGIIDESVAQNQAHYLTVIEIPVKIRA
ncbi:MerR family transcriptional regulator [Paenibacillus sp. J5C_2022]|nr:MerR family transcriptional regulator [Paenibacillus sp. J5C2022]MCU6712993.1 MerR family transcriptional regulator [Paenibacillus sp. J5C2022]